MSKILVFLPHRVWHRILCLGHVLTIRGMCPSRRRQWADFLVPLAAPLHRQYKTARTETRWHLLLKIGQMPTQTSASRGYVLFDIKMAFMPSVVWCRQGAHTKALKLSAECGHISRSAQNLERHGSSRMSNAVRIRNTGFCDQNDRLRLHPETSENFYIIRALFPAASAFGGMFIPLYLRSWYLREDSASCQYRGSRHL